ncbi:hypothetical protein GP486_005648, partial [Trichoglossum hirsutum]
MPPMEAFPKSHIVTYRYYVGVIWFLEEDYVKSLKRGNLAGFDAALVAGEDQFVRRRIYLTLERGRDIALRNLLRKVFLAGGFVVDREGQKVRRTRIDVEEFGAGIGMAAGVKGGMERDEVECLLANMIYK